MRSKKGVMPGAMLASTISGRTGGVFTSTSDRFFLMQLDGDGGHLLRLRAAGDQGRFDTTLDPTVRHADVGDQAGTHDGEVDVRRVVLRCGARW